MSHSGNFGKLEELKNKVVALELEKANAWIMLPFITKEVREEFIHTDLIELDDNGEYQWTQIAVDFACCISPKRQLAQLTGKNKIETP